MKFLSPTVDMVFKRLFGDKKHTERTKSFLNAVLERKPGSLITDVTIEDVSNIPPLVEDKKSFVDLKCRDEKGIEYIVEMQSAKQAYFLKRATYYTSFDIVDQVNRHRDYEFITPVIFIGVLDFEVFQDKDISHPLTHHLLKETITNKQIMRDVEFHFIELKKFKKSLEELETDTDRWIYFIKEADALNAIPKEFDDNDMFAKAFNILEESAWTREERIAYMKTIDLRWQEKHRITAAREDALKDGIEQGIEEGKKEGIEQGRKDGIQQGIEQGEKKRNCEIAINMLAANIELDTISMVTGLNVDEIKKLKK